MSHVNFARLDPNPGSAETYPELAKLACVHLCYCLQHAGFSLFRPQLLPEQHCGYVLVSEVGCWKKLD